jgi:hypothetical protein
LTVRSISACGCREELRAARSIITIAFSPGAIGCGSDTIRSTETTPGSELKT